MKKMLLCLLVLGMCLGVTKAGCDGDDDPPQHNPGESAKKAKK